MLRYFIFVLLVSAAAEARSVYVNGIDVSSAINQNLKSVDIVIDERGDVFISAPHYQVQEEENFMPLGKTTLPLGRPEHRNTGVLERIQKDQDLEMDAAVGAVKVPMTPLPDDAPVAAKVPASSPTTVPVATPAAALSPAPAVPAKP